MRSSVFLLDIHGDPPALGGQICEAILCQQFWHRGVLPLVDVGAESGVVGARLVEYRMEPTERGSRLTFFFDNGRRVVLEDTDDHTAYRVE
jgi:hypothetical protein